LRCGGEVIASFEDGLVCTVLSLLVRCGLNLLVSVKVASVLVEHVGQDVLSILQSLHHLQVG